MSKRLRTKPSPVVISDSLAKSKLSEVDEDLEMTFSSSAIEQSDSVSPAIDQAQTPAPDMDTKSPSKNTLEKNLSISR